MKIITLQQRPAQIEVISRLSLGRDPQLCCKNIRVALNINTPTPTERPRVKSSCIWLKRAPACPLADQMAEMCNYSPSLPGAGVRCEGRCSAAFRPGYYYISGMSQLILPPDIYSAYPHPHRSYFSHFLLTGNKQYVM